MLASCVDLQIYMGCFYFLVVMLIIYFVNLVLRNETGQGRRYQPAPALGAIVHKGNVEEIFYLGS